MSQRRTRSGARFQCALLQRWDPTTLVELLALTSADRLDASLDLADAATGVESIAGAPIRPAIVESALFAHLPR